MSSNKPLPSTQLPPHANTVFQRWHADLSPQEKCDFASEYGCSQTMVRANFLIPTGHPLLTMKTYNKRTRGNPNHEAMVRIAAATRGACSYKDIVNHFVPTEDS